MDYEVRWRKWGSGDAWETAVVPQTAATSATVAVGTWYASLQSYLYTISGLSNATRYEVGVSAVNRAGASPRVEDTLAPCPRGRTYIHAQAACNIVPVPGVPRNLTLTPSNSSITARWDAPESIEGYPIVSYVVQWYKYNGDAIEQVKEQRVIPASRGRSITPRGRITRYHETLNNLANGETYWVEVAAKNTARQSNYAYDTAVPCVGPYNPATKSCATKPLWPQELSAVSADGGLLLSWGAPLADGGSDITSYKITWIRTEGGAIYARSTTISVDEARLRTSQGVSVKIWSVRLPYPATLPALKNDVSYRVYVAAVNAAGTGIPASVKSMPCSAGETYKKEYSGCVPISCPTGSERLENGECVPECGEGEAYEETRGGCRPTDDFCEAHPNLKIARTHSGYCQYAWNTTPARNNITYTPVACDQPHEFSAQANADTYINTDLKNKDTGKYKDLTIGKNPMCPPTGLFLALGERRRHQNHPADYYHPEWAIENDLKNRHQKVVVRASGDCTGLSDVVEIANLVVAAVTFGRVRRGLPSGVLAACQAHDYCYDLIRSGLHQTVSEGRDKGCDEVLKQLWFSYCGTLSGILLFLIREKCKNDFFSANLLVRLATTSPEAGVVMLRNSRTGKCLTSKPAPAKVVQEQCRFDENHKPNDEDQWFHVLQAEPFSDAADGPTEPGYFYVIPASINLTDKDSWKKSLNSQENEVAGDRCLYVNSVSSQEVSPPVPVKVREGSCMVGGVRSESRVFQLENTSVADEYGIRSPGGGCWQPKAGADDAATAGDGVFIVSVSSVSGCSGVLQWWRIEPVDSTAIPVDSAVASR